MLVSTGVPAQVRATQLCSESTSGWCIARRISGSDANGELGFRFGEPLDVDGDGHADLAGGARFKREGISRVGRVSVWSGSSGALLRSWDGGHRNGIFGHWVLLTPDLGSDGLADVVASAPTAIHEGILRGIVVALSPKSGAELWRRIGEPDETIGWDLALAGDQNGDGRVDLFAGAPGAAGRVHLLDGRDGRSLRVYAPKEPVPSFGWYVARLDDLDADGRSDLAVGAYLERDEGDSVVGAAYVFSAATGVQLQRWQGQEALTGFGEVVASVADLDGDGRGELAVSSPRTNDDRRSLAGDVRIYSTKTGGLLRHWTGKQPGELYGRMVAGAGDLDRDGVEDLAIGAPWYRTAAGDRSGRVELRSAKTEKVLGELTGEQAESWFGWHIRRAPDPDRRGRPALLISSLRQSVGGLEGAGVLDLYVLESQ